jgi:hypothetical protein
MATAAIKEKDRSAVLQSLSAGVVPRSGQHLIQVGRKRELEALGDDIKRITEGGASFRMLVGDYGSGKTFLLNLNRARALEKGLVTMHADLNPDRSLRGGRGQSRSLFKELVKNTATRTRPEGGALPGILDKFLSHAAARAESEHRSSASVIREHLAELGELVNGADFVKIIETYRRAIDEGLDELKEHALNWLRGEIIYATDAYVLLGVRSVVTDGTWYDQLKLMARLVRLAGYNGLLVCIDELVNLYRISGKVTRQHNYDQLLRILNDAYSGSAEGLGFVFGCTPDALRDPIRGCYSYEALHTRLADNQFVQGDIVDFTKPVMQFGSLSLEDFHVLLENILRVHAGGDEKARVLPLEALPKFMDHCELQLGSAYYRTPRTVIMAFVDLLQVLAQNKKVHWQDLLRALPLERDTGQAIEKTLIDDESSGTEPPASAAPTPATAFRRRGRPAAQA